VSPAIVSDFISKMVRFALLSLYQQQSLTDVTVCECTHVSFISSLNGITGLVAVGVLKPPTLLHQALNLKIDKDAVAQHGNDVL